ncbi:TPA: hypothetical protein EYP44_04210 [Candidatus Bathyarchaeota archaeon]|nr:hypothetical protein [Candidatus Bathyarchaeota archaeon]
MLEWLVGVGIFTFFGFVFAIVFYLFAIAMAIGWKYGTIQFLLKLLGLSVVAAIVLVSLVVYPIPTLGLIAICLGYILWTSRRRKGEGDRDG